MRQFRNDYFGLCLIRVARRNRTTDNTATFVERSPDERSTALYSQKPVYGWEYGVQKKCPIFYEKTEHFGVRLELRVYYLPQKPIKSDCGRGY